MDFAPDTSTAGYERYISESESTDGEGDVSGGQQRRKSRVSGPGAPEHPLAKDHHHRRQAPSSGYQHGTASSFSSSSSIFSRLAASWKKGSDSAARAKEASGNGTTGYNHGNNHDVGLSAATASGAGALEGGGGGGAVWTDIREGSPRAGDGGDDGSGRGFGGVGGSRCVGTAAFFEFCAEVRERITTAVGTHTLYYA